MIQQMQLLLRRGFDGDIGSSQENSIKATLRRILGKTRKHARILTVHGSMDFNAYLLASIPDVAGSGCTRIQSGLRDFRSKQHFDMLFYSQSQNTVHCNGGFLEDLCYCRMLLKTGSFLFLVMDRTTQQNAAGWFTKGRSREASWLRQAGFANITTHKMGKEFILVGGQRPWQRF